MIPLDIRATAKAFVDGYLASDGDLEGFIAEALMAERERCAKIADGSDRNVVWSPAEIAAAIRQSSEGELA